MSTLRELQQQRDALNKEIRERESALEQLSIDNLLSDIGDIGRSDTLTSIAQKAAKYGLALTTTKDTDDEAVLLALRNKYGVHQDDAISALSKAIVEGMAK